MATGLFNPRFAPVAELGDIVALRGSAGFIVDDADTPFYEVSHVEPSVALGVRGTIVIWCATNAPAAPYKADKAAAVGANLGVQVAATASLDIYPDFAVLQKRQFGQFRFLMREVPDSNAAVVPGVIQDIDLRISAPAASPRGGTQRTIGVINTAFQGHIPADSANAAAQGANVAASANVDNDPFDKAARTETFLYGGESGSAAKLTLTNNGSAALSTGAIGLNVGLFLFNLVPVEAQQVQSRRLLGRTVPVPAAIDLRQVKFIPVSAEPVPPGLA